MAFVLPNRKAFADHVARIFLKYRKVDTDPLDEADTEADLCARQGDMSKGTGKLFPYQALVRDYLAIESPYRGLLLYHGLGSGKTCSSIAVAESLLSQKKIIVMLPASLQDNYRGEIRKCGDPVYRRENSWQERFVRSDADRTEARSMGISDTFLGRTAGRFFVTQPGQPSNFATLPKDVQILVQQQIDDVINQRFTFINYNGLSREAVNKMLSEGNPFEDSVVIIDEAHNLISRVSNESEIATPIYNAIMKSPTTKVVALSGTPVINAPREVALLMNLLRGTIQRITIPMKVAGTWDEMKMATVFRGVPEIDTIEFNAVKKAILVTRNPPQFRSVYNEKGDRTSVQYVKDMKWTPDPLAWVQKLQPKLETDLPGIELQVERVSLEDLECLPSKAEDFDALFRDGLNIKNPMLFMRRIQGLVSYFKGADERMLPKRIEDDKMLEKITMSSEQLGVYLQTRFQEIQRDAKRRTMNDDGGTYRVGSRLVCDFTIPSELRDTTEVATANENAVPDKSDILERLRSESAKYLTEEALAKWSPKMLKMIRNLKDSVQGDARRSQFVYSQYRSLEGLGVFSAILEANGFQRYRIISEGGQWKEDPSMEDKPSYAFYTGEEKPEERELMRQIFNGSYTDTFPQSLKDSIAARGKKLLCVLLASRSGAEGITLANVRHVHIMEPHWNPAITEQVIGRAIRICSHASLPVSERTVRVSYYLSIIPESARTGTDNNLVFIRRTDMELKRYEGEPQEAFMSTDEHLYELSYEKAELAKRISVLLKQAAVDCEIHRKLHLKNEPGLVCMRFDTTVTGDDLAFKPSILSDERDVTYQKNKTRRARTLEKIQVKGCVMLRDPVTKDIFDAPSFDDAQRLLLIGKQVSDRQIQWITSSPC